jgi:hypothetical protein
MITTGTPHKGTPFGRIYDYLQQNCLPESTHKNDNGDSILLLNVLFVLSL